MPRAPRLIGREHHFFSLTYPAGRQLRGNTLFYSFARFFSFFFSFVFAVSIYFSALVSFLFGTYAHCTQPTLRCHDCSLQLPITGAGAPPFGGLAFLCTSRNLSLLFFCCCFRSSSPCSGQHCDLSLSRVSGSRGGGAESHTYSPHDARGMRIRALKFRQRTSIPLGLLLFIQPCQLPEGMAPEHDNKVLLSLPKNEVRGGMFSLPFF